MSPVLASLLAHMRGHDGFRELLSLVSEPTIQPFRLSEAERPETARSRFIYQSGQAAQHQAWLAALIGESTSQQEK